MLRCEVDACENYPITGYVRCTMHRPEFRCSVPGCEQFRCGIGQYASKCYIHVSRAVNGEIFQWPEKVVKTVETTVKVHGTMPMYKSGCKCDKCVSANTKYQKYYRMKIKLKDLPLPKHIEQELEFLLGKLAHDVTGQNQAQPFEPDADTPEIDAVTCDDGSASDPTE